VVSQMCYSVTLCKKVKKKIAKKLAKKKKKLSKSCQKFCHTWKKTNKNNGAIVENRANSSSKAFGISFADRPKAKRRYKHNALGYITVLTDIQLETLSTVLS
jgi:indole-3-glycerol phosphate synthase